MQPCRYRALALAIAVSAAALAGLSAAANADDGASTGQWRTKSQLAWDSARSQLVRRTLRVWDVQPERNLDFFWEPETPGDWPAAETLEGRGTLTWRSSSTASYDRSGIAMTFKGDMRNGRAHGAGQIETADGLSYNGMWRDGLMDGEGHLRLANGDEYQGGFRAGLYHGQGVFTAANGERYSGQYADGKRHGSGTLLRTDGSTLSTIWRDDKPAGDLAERPQLAQFPGGTGTLENDSTLAVITDAKKNARTRSLGDSYHGTPIVYRHRINPDGIRIEPDDDRLLKMWSDEGEMFRDNEKSAQHYTDDYGMVFQSPAWLSFKIPGFGGGKALKSLKLKIDSSATENRPFLEVAEAYSDVQNCGVSKLGTLPKFRVINFGWGKARNTSIEFTFSGANGKRSRVFEKRLTDLSEWSEISVEDAAAQLHGDLKALKSIDLKCDFDFETGRDNTKCTGKMVEDECFLLQPAVKACQDNALASAPLGGLRPYTFIGGSWKHILNTNVEGRYRYTWTDSQGTPRKASASFKIPIALASITMKVPAECGDGGPDLPAAGVPVAALSAGKSSYEWSYPLKTALPIPAAGKVLTIGAFAPKSSSHKFRVVAEFTDGAKSESKPVDFLYVRPSQPERPPPDTSERE